MKIDYDTEFLELGPAHPIRLISIGMVRDDGRELYMVNRAVHDDGWLHQAICEHDWIMQNVVPHLPLQSTWGGGPSIIQRHGHFRADFELDTSDPAVKTAEEIRDAVAGFVLSAPDPELWAYYAAYDHVVLAQLFGVMANLPAGFPMHTHDLKQEVVRLGGPKLPQMTGAAHNALDDARWVRESRLYLESLDAKLYG